MLSQLSPAQNSFQRRASQYDDFPAHIFILLLSMSFTIEITNDSKNKGPIMVYVVCG
jgi:thiamine phosphate synthase YjbQ (UPF0047 family)